MAEALSMIVLAGGRSSRMGTDKADLVCRGRTFLNLQIDKGKELGIDDIMVSGYRGAPCGVRVVKDRLEDRGPLGGLEACLREAVHPRCLVLSVDVPLVTVPELRALIACGAGGSHSVTILEHGGKQEPLIGVYHVSLADAMLRALERGKGSVFGFLREQGFDVYRSPAEETQFSNINEPEDYRRIVENTADRAK